MSDRTLKVTFPDMKTDKIKLPHLPDFIKDDEWKNPAVIAGLLVAAGFILGGYCYYRHYKGGSR